VTNPTGRPLPAAGVEVEDLDDDACLYRPDIDEVLVLNRSAADVWRLADGTRTADEISDMLARAYQTNPDDVRPDVESVLGDLSVRGYLSWPAEPHSDYAE
jgi:hypothetical protein